MTDNTLALVAATTSDQTATLVAAVIAACAALIAAALSFYSAFYQADRQGKLKLAEFRRDWIESLRQRLADFLTLFFAINRDVENLNKQKPKELALSEKISQNKIKLAGEFYYIKLCLNLNEKKHQELLEILELMLSKDRETVQAEMEKRGFSLSEKAREILKFEWDKLKQEM